MNRLFIGVPGRLGDLLAAIDSEEPTLQRYRAIRRDGKILDRLLRDGEGGGGA